MFQITLSNGKRFGCPASTSILEAARAEGVVLEHNCRTGRCGQCKAPVKGGSTTLLRAEVSLSADQVAQGVILTCCRAAESDVALDVEDLGRLAGVKARILPCRIASIKRLSPTIVAVKLRLPPNAKLDYLPGQYIDVIVGQYRRSYSLANAPRADGTLDLLIRQVTGGVLSSYWFERAVVNDLLRLEAPLGTFFLREDDGPITFLATGTGIAPVRAMIEELGASGQLDKRAVRIYWGNRSPEDFVWAPDGPVEFYPVLSRPTSDWKGRIGYVQDALLADGYVDIGSVYACGSDVMIRSAEAALVQLGLPAHRFHSDAFLSSN